MNFTPEAMKAEYERGRREAVRDVLKFIIDDSKTCDCFAYEEGECACGAWSDWKSVPLTPLIDRIAMHMEAANG